MQVLHAYTDVGGRALPGASAEEHKPARNLTPIQNSKGQAAISAEITRFRAQRPSKAVPHRYAPCA